LEGNIKELGFNLSRGYGADITWPMECQQIKLGSCTIQLLPQSLQKFDIIFHPQNDWPCWVDINKSGVVDCKLNMDKLHILCAAISKYSVLNRKEDGRVGRLCSVADDIALDVVEAQNSQLGEIKPAVVEEAKPVIDVAIDPRAQVKLHAQGILLEPNVDVLSG
jgi:hypothetical protein